MNPDLRLVNFEERNGDEDEIKKMNPFELVQYFDRRQYGENFVPYALVKDETIKKYVEHSDSDSDSDSDINIEAKAIAKFVKLIQSNNSYGDKGNITVYDIRYECPYPKKDEDEDEQQDPNKNPIYEMDHGFYLLRAFMYCGKDIGVKINMTTLGYLISKKQI